MKQRNLIIGAVVLVVVLIVSGIWLYDWVLGDTQEATESISAVPLELEPTAAPVETEAMASPTPEMEPTATVALIDPTQPAAGASEASEAAIGLVVYQIVQEESQVRFNIFEELRGQPKDVIGVSDQVAGEAAVDLGDLGATQIGVIQVNARTLVTDDDRRNQAIRNRILHTDQYEFVVFTPTEIIGLTGSGVPGQPFSFQVAGDLAIQEITQPVVFDVTVTGESPERLAGMASTVIRRSDYKLIVPDLPFIANVSEEVMLEIDFVMVAR